MDCAWRSRTCPAGSGAVLRSFFDGTGERIRALDPDAVIWNGLAGGGQCGSAGADYAMVAASPGVDVLEYHDYSPGPELADELRQRIGQAQAVGKPLVVAELGLPGGSCLPAAERKARLRMPSPRSGPPGRRARCSGRSSRTRGRINARSMSARAIR